MRTRIEIKPLFYLGLAVAILAIPMRWLLAWLAAAAVHEGFHLLMLRVLGVCPYSVELDLRGAAIKTGAMEPWKEFLCAAAGPLGSFSLLFLSRWMPLVALCGCLQGSYNLLPLYSMDGGRATRCLLRAFLRDDVAEYILRALQVIIYVLLFSIGLYCLFWLSLGPLPILFAAMLTLKGRKTPCKLLPQKVQ